VEGKGASRSQLVLDLVFHSLRNELHACGAAHILQGAHRMELFLGDSIRDHSSVCDFADHISRESQSLAMSMEHDI
jgi:hypothetical protein